MSGKGDSDTSEPTESGGLERIERSHEYGERGTDLFPVPAVQPLPSDAVPEMPQALIDSPPPAPPPPSDAEG